MKIIEVTPDNEAKYLDQIAKLEEVVLDRLVLDGREGQLFATGKEDVSVYVHSKENTVIVAVDDNDRVLAVTYITQGQKPFTYNDITKYFKYSDKYRRYVQGRYQDKGQLLKDLIEHYRLKLRAFRYAKECVLAENGKDDILIFLEEELKQNGFHEKSALREGLNDYMAKYIEQNGSTIDKGNYDKFYWFTMQDIDSVAKELGIDFQIIENLDPEERSLSAEYERIMAYGQVVIHEPPTFDETKYYNANTSNSIELDTYITAPNYRDNGITRLIVFEGVKKHMGEFFEKPDNEEIFLCSTLHRDNCPSKYVSEFFGLTDSLFVNRRQGRDREVHICCVPREGYEAYLEEMYDKLAVLYGYNPMGKRIDNSTTQRVISEKIAYDNAEIERLNRLDNLGVNENIVRLKRKKVDSNRKRLK